MLKIKKICFFQSFLLIGIIFASSFLIFNASKSKFETQNIQNINIESQPHVAAPFQFLQEFQPSTYYISPETSPGQNDMVYFTFMANRNGNYSIDIKNYPNSLTKTSKYEWFSSFDNPNGSNSMYISYIETETANPVNATMKLIVSHDKGKTWKTQTIKSLATQGSDPSEHSFYLVGTALATSPNGVIGTITWVNQSDLVYIGSEDNGNSWKNPFQLINTSNIGRNYFKDYWFSLLYPQIELAILQNGTIFALTEANSTLYTPIIYFQSNDKGATWSEAKNVTCTDGLKSCKPKIQVDYTTGNYWLMWLEGTIEVGYNNISWAQFALSESLSSNVLKHSVFNASDTNYYDFDFFYDINDINYPFKVIQNKDLNSEKSQIIEWKSNSFSSLWIDEILGESEALKAITVFILPLNMYFDGEYYQFFYDPPPNPDNPDVYQYVFFKNSTFWQEKGTFSEYQTKQIEWNGRINNTIPINTSIVEVIFTAQNGTESSITKTVFITIDNINPLFDVLTQQRGYFNPKSSTITLSNIQWDILPSKVSTAKLEIYSPNITTSNWEKITNNNWENSNPCIFISNTGQLYVLYKTLELNRYVLYLIRSDDKGISWTNPLKICEDPQSFTGAAWNNFVCIYIKKGGNPATFFRSFDMGNTFQSPIDLYNLDAFKHLPIRDIYRIVFTNNGTMFITLKDVTGSDNTSVYTSNNLGINWTLSGTWALPKNSMKFFNPDIVYDHINDLVHFVMFNANSTIENGINVYHYANLTFSTLNVTNGKWGPIKDVGISPFGYIPDSDYKFAPKFLISKDSPILPIKVSAIVLTGYENGITPIYKESSSTDLGDNWSEAAQIAMTSETSFISDINETYFVKVMSLDSRDAIYFSRKGQLVRIQKELLSSTYMSQITFNGIDDFGSYLTAGKYKYNLFLQDDAGNQNCSSGWFYVDYTPPKLTDFYTNWAISPIPRFDVLVSVNAYDTINFTTFLYYKKDDHDWQKVQMIESTQNIFTAIITGDKYAYQIQYYIESVDLAGNEFKIDNGGSYFVYDIPRYQWECDGLFKESKSYSSGNDYKFKITITKDLEYVEKVLFRYSYDEGKTWKDLELKQGSPEFSGTLKNIPDDLRTLYYQTIIVDLWGDETIMTDTQKVLFYPEIPSIVFENIALPFIITISAIIGFIVAYSYIRLKNTSHEMMSKQILAKEYIKKTGELKKNESIKKREKTEKKETIAGELETLKKSKAAISYSKANLGILCSTIVVFAIGILIAQVIAELGMILVALSLLMAVFGYMILVSRDITVDLYMEKIYKRNIALETFQIFFLFINLMMILFIGYSISWFRYYLIESTFHIGSVFVPKLYISLFSIFVTSLVFVIISIYLQLRKSVKNLRSQRSKGASNSVLLYLKDQNASRLITQTGYKTIVFLITVFFGIVSTTNLLTLQTGISLSIIIIPFAIASFSTLLIHCQIEKKRKKQQKKEFQIQFIDTKKICTKCGQETYLSDKFCSLCGAQQIFSEAIGTYILKCPQCESLVNDKAKYCPSCGTKIGDKTKDLRKSQM